MASVGATPPRVIPLLIRREISASRTAAPGAWRLGLQVLKTRERARAPGFEMNSSSFPDPKLMHDLAAAVRLEAKQRRQLLGWWLPGAAALVWVLLGGVLGLPLPYWVIGLGMMFIFHRYHRWKLRVAYERVPVWHFGQLGPPRELSRGHRQSHGLMHPVELTVDARYVLSPLNVTAAEAPERVPRCKCVFWVDGELLVEFEEGQYVGVLQVGEESVLAASAGECVIIARGWFIPPQLETRVRRARAPSLGREPES